MKFKKKDIDNIINILNKLKEETKDIPEDHFIEFKDSRIISEPDFVLSNKWCIKAENKEQAEIIFKYHNSFPSRCWDVNNNHHVDLYAFYGVRKDGGPDSGTNHRQGYQELTFEQFKKYILNEN